MQATRRKGEDMTAPATIQAEAGDMLQAALDYADKGLPVFPCNPASKRPLTAHGFKDAARDSDQINRWWLEWPDAMIGIPAGAQTRFWALDIDDPAAFEAACKIELPKTRRVDTGKGYHLYFKFDPDKPVTNKQKNPKTGEWPFPELPGAETRGEGGYVIVPPSLHPSGRRYAWHGEATIVEAPKALLAIVRRERTSRRREVSKVAAPRQSTPYGLAALQQECATVRDADNGAQEAALNEAALKIGALVAGGEIDRATARQELSEAALDMPSHNPRDPWTFDHVARKIERGLDDGARNPRSAPAKAGVKREDFHAYMPAHSYIFAPDGQHWPASSVNARLESVPLHNRNGEPMLDAKGNPVTIKPSAWLDEHRPVEQVTWIPGKPQVITDKLVSDGGWIDRPGCNVFNLYRPPMSTEGDPDKAKPWLDHLRRVYPDYAAHLVSWFAQRVQRPQEKINHAIVLGGAQGIGKDTILEPLKAAIGPWNMSEVSPQHLLGSFNGFVKSVILRVSEARDLGDVDRFAFYDHMKTYTAAPPDVLRVNEKHLREYSVFNVTGVIITSNHKSDGLYLPADDRRHYVAWSNLNRDSFPEDYWRKLYAWYGQGGIGHVAAYLQTLDLTGFDPKAPPPKTPAFWDIVSANHAPEDAELADALETLGWPHAVTIASIADTSQSGFSEWLTDRRNSRRLPHRMEQCGYVPVRNPAANDGLFKVGGKRCVIYARNSLAMRDQIAAAETLLGW